MYLTNRFEISDLGPPFSFCSSPDHRVIHSFPTRRSSDLQQALARAQPGLDGAHRLERLAHRALELRQRGDRAALVADRSEEHTSELQSQSNLVCRPLLEKKKPQKACIN